jgi:hypothetical protein
MMNGDWLSLKKKEAAAATDLQHTVKEFYLQNQPGCKQSQIAS